MKVKQQKGIKRAGKVLKRKRRKCVCKQARVAKGKK